MSVHSSGYVYVKFGAALHMGCNESGIPVWPSFPPLQLPTIQRALSGGLSDPEMSDGECASPLHELLPLAVMLGLTLSMIQ